MSDQKDFTVHAVQNKDHYLLELKGELSYPNSSYFQEQINQSLTHSWDAILIDFSEVSYVSSVGLRVLLKLGKDIIHTNKKLVLFGFNEVVSAAFKVCGLDKVFDIQPDKDSALQSIQSS